MSKGVYEASRLQPGDLAVFLTVRKLSLVFCCKHCCVETFLSTKDFSIFSSELGLNLGLVVHNPPLCIFCYGDRFKDKHLEILGTGCRLPCLSNGILVWVTSRGPFQSQPFRDLGKSLWYLMLNVSHSSWYWVFNAQDHRTPSREPCVTPFFGNVPWVTCPETAHCPPRRLGESFPFLWMLFSKAFVPRIEQYYQCLRFCPCYDLSEASIQVSIKPDKHWKF